MTRRCRGRGLISRQPSLQVQKLSDGGDGIHRKQRHRVTPSSVYSCPLEGFHAWLGPEYQMELPPAGGEEPLGAEDDMEGGEEFSAGWEVGSLMITSPGFPMALSLFSILIRVQSQQLSVALMASRNLQVFKLTTADSSDHMPMMPTVAANLRPGHSISECEQTRVATNCSIQYGRPGIPYSQPTTPLRITPLLLHILS